MARAAERKSSSACVSHLEQAVEEVQGGCTEVVVHLTVVSQGWRAGCSCTPPAASTRELRAAVTWPGAGRGGPMLRVCNVLIVNFWHAEGGTAESSHIRAATRFWIYPLLNKNVKKMSNFTQLLQNFPFLPLFWLLNPI